MSWICVNSVGSHPDNLTVKAYVKNNPTIRVVFLLSYDIVQYLNNPKKVSTRLRQDGILIIAPGDQKALTQKNSKSINSQYVVSFGKKLFGTDSLCDTPTTSLPFMLTREGILPAVYIDTERLTSKID